MFFIDQLQDKYVVGVIVIKIARHGRDDRNVTKTIISSNWSLFNRHSCATPEQDMGSLLI